jgi:hypothetical protein
LQLLNSFVRCINIATMMIQEIVGILKQPPFSENLTLMSFDEKKESELLDLIVKILAMIDAELTNDKSDTQEILKSLIEFLKLVNFPYAEERYNNIIVDWKRI